MSASIPPDLAGDRVTLRALRLADAAALNRWHKDTEFSVLDGIAYKTNLAYWRQFVRNVRTSQENLFWGVEHKSTLVGYISLKRVNNRDRNADFGIAIERTSWGNGYGRDATLVVLRFAFADLKLNRVALTVLASNERARRLYESCGFREEGILRKSKLYHGEYVDNVVMAVLASDTR